MEKLYKKKKLEYVLKKINKPYNILGIKEKKNITKKKFNDLKNKYKKLFNKCFKKEILLKLINDIKKIYYEMKKTYNYDLLIEEDNLIFTEFNSIEYILISYYFKTNNLLENESINNIEYLKKHDILKKENRMNDIYKKELLNEEILNQGAYGQVYLLNNNKIIKKQNITNIKYKEDLDRIINEIYILKKLNNTILSLNISDYWIEIDEKKIILYIVMDYKGITLEKWINNNNLKEEHICEIKKKLDLLHKNKIYHNDLHIENILVNDKDNNVEFTIIDYGLSTTLKNNIDLNIKWDKDDIYQHFNNENNLVNLIVNKVKEMKLLDTLNK